MILVDTSIWIDHLRGGDAGLTALLNDSRVITHSFVIGELACGRLRNRREILALLDALPRAPFATDPEVLFFIEQHRLMGQGIGYIDAHLLAAASLAEPARLWTRDKALLSVAHSLNLAYVS